MTEARKKMTLPGLYKKVEDGQPITWLTCYDYPTAYMQDQAGVDMILVGDSLGMTMLGFDSTLPVTMDDMIRHAAAVRRGAPNVWLVGDMPYMTYQPSVESAQGADRLRGESQMTDGGNTRIHNTLDAVSHCRAAFEFDAVTACFRHEASRVANCIFH